MSDKKYAFETDVWKKALASAVEKAAGVPFVSYNGLDVVGGFPTKPCSTAKVIDGPVQIYEDSAFWNEVAFGKAYKALKKTNGRSAG